jgi:hypothetical protein
MCGVRRRINQVALDSASVEAADPVKLFSALGVFLLSGIGALLPARICPHS